MVTYFKVLQRYSQYMSTANKTICRTTEISIARVIFCKKNY